MNNNVQNFETEQVQQKDIYAEKHSNLEPRYVITNKLSTFDRSLCIIGLTTCMAMVGIEIYKLWKE